MEQVVMKSVKTYTVLTGGIAFKNLITQRKHHQEMKNRVRYVMYFFVKINGNSLHSRV
jgi:hypothetical protein